MPDHGTPACYTSGCRQPECTKAAADYEGRRKRLIAYGRWSPWGDLDAVRAHVKGLRSKGLTLDRIAALAGVGTVTVQRIAYPSYGYSKVQSKVATAVLAVEASDDALTPFALVDSAGTRRRAQALAAIGWSLKWQAGELGMWPESYRSAIASPRVRRRLREAVRELYDAYSMTVPPDSRSTRATVTLARRWGYLPPLAWDDDLIDLPDDELAAELERRAAAMTSAEAAACYSAHHNSGDRSPLILAGAREYKRRKRTRHRQRDRARRGRAAA